MTDVEKTIPGAQTGADRAALDFANEHGVCRGGWCSRARRAENIAAQTMKFQMDAPPSGGETPPCVAFSSSNLSIGHLSRK